MRFEKAIPYDILIRGTPNQGFIVEVGCVKVAYAQAETLLNDLTEYLKYPKEVEKQYNHDISSLGRVHIGPGAPIFSATALSRMTDDMLEAQQRKERANNPELKTYSGGEVKYPIPSTHKHKETEL